MLWGIIYQHLQPSFFSSFSFSFLLFCIRAEQVLLTQKPAWISGQLGDQIQMNCQQTNTDHNWMYWYRQTVAKQQLELIGYIGKGASQATYEDGFEKQRFEIQQKHSKHCSLQINKMSSEDAAVYFCASSFTVLKCFRSSLQEPSHESSHGSLESKFASLSLSSLLCVCRR